MYSIILKNDLPHNQFTTQNAVINHHCTVRRLLCDVTCN